MHAPFSRGKALYCAIVALMIPLRVPQIIGGTIVAMRREPQRFIVIADSRLTVRGTGIHRDDACKLIGLDDKTFFFSTGTEAVWTESIRFDVQDIARSVFRRLRNRSNNAERLHFVSNNIAEALKGSYEQAAYRNLTFVLNAAKDSILSTAVVGGTMDNGDLLADAIHVRIGPTIGNRPVITSTLESVGEQGDLPNNVFGQTDLFKEFWDDTTERAKTANKRLAALVQSEGADTASVVRLKVAVEAAIEWSGPDGDIGGALDILELRSGKTIHWIRRKDNCKN